MRILPDETLIVPLWRLAAGLAVLAAALIALLLLHV
jgi:hypothetical protein